MRRSISGPGVCTNPYPRFRKESWAFWLVLPDARSKTDSKPGLSVVNGPVSSPAPRWVGENRWAPGIFSLFTRKLQRWTSNLQDHFPMMNITQNRNGCCYFYSHVASYFQGQSAMPQRRLSPKGGQPNYVNQGQPQQGREIHGSFPGTNIFQSWPGLIYFFFF